MIEVKIAPEEPRRNVPRFGAGEACVRIRKGDRPRPYLIRDNNDGPEDLCYKLESFCTLPPPTETNTFADMLPLNRFKPVPNASLNPQVQSSISRVRSPL